jgi:RNA polymerase sigma-70 factor (ECF subfamily)
MAAHSTYTDQELVALLKQGDDLAFREVFERYSSLLYQHTFNKIRNSEEARDVVQEVFAKLWAKHDELDFRTLNLKGYLYTTARNAVFDLLRHKVHVDAYAASYTRFVADHVAETDYLIREKQFAAIIEAEIAALPPKMREVFELRRVENLSNKEIAEKLNLSEHTVKDQMKKALKILRPKIGLVIIMAQLMH